MDSSFNPAHTAAADELLKDYLSEPSGPAATALLNQLFEQYLAPWCSVTAHRVLRNHGLRGGDQFDDQSEITAEVLLHLTTRLQELRRTAAPPIVNLRAYAVSAVYNACFARVRTRCPHYARLRNRLRYLLRNDSTFALWTPASGEPLAGLRAWQDRDDHTTVPPSPPLPGPLRPWLLALFQMAAAPLRLGELVSAAAEALGIADTPATLLDPEHPSTERPADFALIERQSLAALWSEVLLLPAAQRAALLLNLRDAAGNGVIELIPSTGLADFRQLAELLNMPPARLAELWPELPLEDARIAEILGLTRQQVINLRKSARERLLRRQNRADSNTSTRSASSSVGARLGSRIQALFRGGNA